MAQALWVDDMEFANTVIVTLDGRRVYQTVIGGDEDMKAIDQLQDPAVEAINARLKNIRFAATAGPHKIGVTFLRRTAAESDDRLQMFLPGGGQDHVLQVRSFQISGPFDPSGVSATPSRERIFSCYPSRAEDEEPCAEEIMTSLAVARVPPAADRASTSATCWQYYRDGAKSGGFEEGIRGAITGILASPYFLYRAEHAPADWLPGEIYEIRGLDLASKLSFFLWNTVPDDELRELALRGEAATTRQVRKQQVERMLADPRAETLASNFARAMAELQRLDEVQSGSRHLSVRVGQRRSARRISSRRRRCSSTASFERIAASSICYGRTTRIVNERVASLYGIRDVKGDRFRRVELDGPDALGPARQGRRPDGVSYPNRTSPVLRGAFILENITGTPPAAPPPNVEAFPEKDVGTTKAKTVREIMAAHRDEPDVLRLPRRAGSARLRAREFRRRGRLARARPFRRHSRSIPSAELPDGTQAERARTTCATRC